MKWFRRFLTFGFLIGVTVWLSGCSGPSSGSTGSIKANYVGSGYSLHIEQMSINTYKFTVVENKNFPGAIFTVYGLNSESQFSGFNTSSRMRLAHVADGNQVGQSFEVTFNNDDNWFVIYEDALVGGSFVYDTTSEMIRGNFRQ